MSHKHTKNIEISDNLHIYYIDFDLLDNGYGQVKDKFYSELFDDIPIKRGEFGELLLYHLLHEYFGADALISKIYFKDSVGGVAHGFDAVHVDTSRRILWLGESKLYKNSSTAINELANDVMNHFNVNFFESEFQIITNRVHDTKINCDDYIIKLLNPETKILDKLADINVCLFAAFESNSLLNFNKNNFEQTLMEEVKRLNEKMNSLLSKHQWIERLNIYLLTFPLDNKREFVSSLHQKLKGAQQI